jgi:hypothetical protein
MNHLIIFDATDCVGVFDINNADDIDFYPPLTISLLWDDFENPRSNIADRKILPICISNHLFTMPVESCRDQEFAYSIADQFDQIRNDVSNFAKGVFTEGSDNESLDDLGRELREAYAAHGVIL